MDPVRTRLSGPVIGCGDAWALAEFYAWLLGWSVVGRSETVPGGWALVRPPSGEQKLEFQREEPFVPPVWPTVAGEQQMGMHLDIAVENLGDGPDRRERFFEVVDHAVSLGHGSLSTSHKKARCGDARSAGHPFACSPDRSRTRRKLRADLRASARSRRRDTERSSCVPAGRLLRRRVRRKSSGRLVARS